MVNAAWRHIVKRPSISGGRHHQKGSPTWHSSPRSSHWLRGDDEGQGLAEYALILALIAIVAIIALIFLGTQVSGILNTVGKSV